MSKAIFPVNWLWMVWLASIVFVIPIPHTIALRNLLILVGFIALVLTGRKASLPVSPWLKPALWWLIALTTWIVVHTVAIAPESMQALDQVRANWLVPFLLAAHAAWATTRIHPKYATRAIVAALAGHMLFLLGWQFNLWLASGYWPIRQTPFGAYDYHGTINSFFLALLLADRMALVIKGSSPLELGRWLGWLLMLVSLLTDLGLQSRNGTLIDLSMFMIGGILLLRSELRRWKLTLLLLAGVAVIGYSSIRFNDRWEGFRESVVVGWTAPGAHWMNLTSIDPSLWPRTPTGRKIEESAFLRAAWARKSTDFLVENPMGIGFGHDAFGRAMALKYSYPGLGSSHSGWLDFALGTGLIGLLLMLACAGSLLRQGWRRFVQAGDGHALVIAFFVGGYLFRCLLDGHLFGWRLTLFGFILGVLIAVSKPAPCSR
jgi:hypothetical protein